MTPYINIFHNKALDPIFIAYIKSHEKWKDWVVPTDEEIEAKTKSFQAIWQENGDKILTAMQNVTGLSFVRNRIDISVVAGNPRSHSNPIIIKSSWTPEEFLNVLTHELIHNLVGDNSEITQNKWKPWTQIVEQYPNEPKLVKNHILVYFIMRKITELTGIEFKEEIIDTEINANYTRAKEIAQTIELEF